MSAVARARAASSGASIIIMDEPTAVLSPLETVELFKTLKKLVAEGMSVIFISHKLNEVMDISSRVVVLSPRPGRIHTIIDVDFGERTDDTRQHRESPASSSLNMRLSRRERFVEVAPTHDALSPFVTVVPLQLYAYCVADHKGTDVDQPRNLAKTVTVE